MTHTALAVLGYATWTVILLCGIFAHRGALILTGQRALNTFSPHGTDVSPFGGRVVRAHANCVENLPVAGAVLLLAVATAHTEVTEALALPFLGARIAQSTAHLISTGTPAITVRFTFFLVQLAILTWWIVGLGMLL